MIKAFKQKVQVQTGPAIQSKPEAPLGEEL
jgi:hypothetical protein